MHSTFSNCPKSHNVNQIVDQIVDATKKGNQPKCNNNDQSIYNALTVSIDSVTTRFELNLHHIIDCSE